MAAGTRRKGQNDGNRVYHLRVVAASSLENLISDNLTQTNKEEQRTDLPEKEISNTACEIIQIKKV